MSMTYIWKNGFHSRGDPAIVGRELEAIHEEHGSIAPEFVVEKATPKNSPLHGYFEWDDSIAAKNFRVDQARYLIRSVAVRIEREDNEPLITRAFVEMKQEEAAGSYVSISTVAQDDDLRRSLIEQALHDVDTFRKKYAILIEVMDLLDELQNELVALK